MEQSAFALTLVLSQAPPDGDDAPPTGPGAGPSEAGGGLPPRRRIPAVLTAVVVMAGLAVGLVVAFALPGDDGVTLTTADLTPADAGLYIALRTDLASDEWVRAFGLAERLGAEDPPAQLREEVEEAAELDWEDEVAPFLGGNAALYLRAVEFDDGGNFEFRGAVIVEADAPDRAMRVIEAQAEFERATYLDVGYLVAADEDVVVGRLGDHVVFALDRESFLEVVDVERGRAPNLTERARFRDLRDAVPERFLAFVYVDPGELGGDALYLDNDRFRRFVEDSGLQESLFEPVAAAISAEGDAFRVDAVSLTVDDASSPLVQPRQSRFAGLAPADTAVFVSTGSIAAAWRQLREDFGDTIDEAIAEDGEFASLDDALRELGGEIGVDSAEEIILQFGGEFAVTLWFPDGDTESVEAVVFAEVVSELDARAIVERILAAQDIDVDTRPDGVRVLEGSGDPPVAYVIQEGYVVMGTLAGVEGVLNDDKASLADSQVYQDAVDELGLSLGTVVFVDLATILDLSGDALPPEARDLRDGLEGLLINIVQDGRVGRSAGVLTVAE